jgi:hypothetical protein
MAYISSAKFVIQIIVHFGPSHIAHNIVGTNAKLIFVIGVFIDKNLESKTSIANKIAVKTIFLFFLIKNPLSFYPA